MIKYQSTAIGRTYNRRYSHEYLTALIKKEIELKEINGSTYLGINQSNDLPKMNTPIHIASDERGNTTEHNIVLLDGNRLRGTEADLRLTLGILMSTYEDGEIGERFYNVRKFATKAYMNWIARGVGNKFNLSFEERKEVEILAATFFYCSANTPKEYLGDGKYKGLADLAEITRYGVNSLEDILKKHELIQQEHIFTFDNLVAKLGSISDRSKTTLTRPNILATLAHSWFGEGGVLYCNLACEYPPMFLTLMYYALIDRGYKRSNLGVLVKEFAVGKDMASGDMFIQQIGSIVKGLKITTP